MFKKLCGILVALLAPIALLAQTTVTPNIGLQVPGYNQANWQVPINYDLQRLDLLLSGNLPIPNLTITGNLSFGTWTVSNPWPVSQGGTGTTNPTPVAGLNMVLTGTWPNNTFATVNSPTFTSVTAPTYFFTSGISDTTGSGAPVSACGASNYGSTYRNTVGTSGAVIYVCDSSGWEALGGGGGYTGCIGVTNGITCTGQLEAGTYLKADANSWGHSIENVQTATIANLGTLTTSNSILAVGSLVQITDAANCGDTTVGGGSIKELLQVTTVTSGSPSAYSVLNCFDPSTAFTSSSMVPASIPNLVLWVSGDRTHWTNGNGVPYWNDSYTGNVATTTAAGATFTTGAINTLPALSFGGSSAGRYLIKYPFNLAQGTIFVVMNITASGAYGSIVSGATNSLEFRFDTTNHLVLTQDFTADIATNATALTTGTWYQVNATYNSSTGSYAFRVNEAAGSSGTNAKTISANNAGIGYDYQSNAQDLNAKIAEIIVYNRVLTGPEITSVETYLHSKYGI